MLTNKDLYMKNLILKFTFLLLPIFSLISCSGNDNDEILDLESIILKVSKNTISANGSDEAVITITRGLDDLTSGSIVEIIAIDGI